MHSDDMVEGECRECEELLETVAEFLDGELSDELRQALVIHAHECRQCARLLSSMRQIVAICRTEPTCDMPGRVREQLWIVLRRELYQEGDSARG
jgi:hypothetical protein